MLEYSRILLFTKRNGVLTYPIGDCIIGFMVTD